MNFSRAHLSPRSMTALAEQQRTADAQAERWLQDELARELRTGTRDVRLLVSEDGGATWTRAVVKRKAIA